MPNTINQGAWIRLREIVNNIEDHGVIKNNIEEALKLKSKYKKQVVSRDKLEYLRHNKIGTTRIENLASQIEHGNKRNPATVVFIVENNLKRVVKTIKTLSSTIFNLDKVIKTSLGSEWRRQLYKDLCHYILAPLWRSEKESSRRSRTHLYKKYKQCDSNVISVENNSIQIHIEPSMSHEERAQFMAQQDNPVSMGVTLSENEIAFLKLPQSLTNHTSFDKVKMFTDVAMMGSKIRMTLKDRLDNGLTEEQVNNRPCELKREEAIQTALKTRVYDPEDKTASFANMRVTSLPTCRRVKIPDPLPEKEEASIQSVITAVEAAIVREEERNKKLKVKTSTLTKAEAMGLKSLKKRTKNGEAAIVATDKSGRLAVMSKSEYERKVSEHTGSDPIVSQSDVSAMEQTLSATASSVARVLQLGETWNQTDRVQSAVKSTCTIIPPLAILLKDHKPGDDKPVRPLCRSSESPNGPLSHLTAKVMNLVAKELNVQVQTEVRSTEEMIAVLDSVNESITPDTRCLEQCGPIQQCDLAKHNVQVHPNHLPSITIGSMDVKALYPSLDVNHSCNIIKKLIATSTVKFNTNHTEMSLHIAATHTQDEIDKLGISDIIHTRRFKNGPRPTIISKSVTGTQTERDQAQSWIHPSRTPTPDEAQLMFAIVISEAVKVVMNNHVYTNGDVIRLQQLGMAIGSSATAEVAKLVMLEHDQLLWENCQKAGINKIVSGRYVDDENPVLQPVPFGSRLINGILQIDQDLVESDKLIPHDRRTFNLVQEVANNIWPNIQFTVDVPSECKSGLIPMLDMEVGINQLGLIIRKFYCKPMNTPYTILSRSAHSWQIKRSTLTQEGVRRLLNTSVEAPNQVKEQILSDWDRKMNRSGYNQSFRTNVIKAALDIYTHKLSVAQKGGRPLYRPSGYQSCQRDTEKLVKKQTWYTGTGQQRNQAPLILDPTPTGLLEKDISNILKEASRLNGIRVKMCQRGGSKVSSAAKSDPFSSILCDREDCNICKTPDSQGKCKHSNVGYKIFCIICNDQGIEASYQGETGKSGYERGSQHADGLARKSEDAPLWKHSEIYHNSVTDLPFGMQITGTFKKAFERQENEAICIRESMAAHQMNSRREFHQPTIVRMLPVSNALPSDQAGSNNQIVLTSRPSKRKAQEQPRVASPNVLPRSRIRSKSPQSARTHNLQTVTTTRRERMDLQMHQAVSRSVMRYHPSIVENREHDRKNYRSPSVNSNRSSRRSKQSKTSSRKRSVSPVQSTSSKHHSPKHHVSRKHTSRSQRSVSPVQQKTSKQKTSNTHISSNHTNNQSKQTSKDYISSNTNVTNATKTTRTARYVSEHISSKHNQTHTTPVKNHTQIPNPTTSPLSPNSFSFAMRKLNGETQGARQLSLSPVSQENFTQYTSQQVVTRRTSSMTTVSMQQSSPRRSQSKISTSSDCNIASDSDEDLFPLDTAFYDKSIPNVFKCTKEKSLIRGEKSKLDRINTVSDSPSDDIPLVQQYISTSTMSHSELESIDEEFEQSWDDNLSHPTPKPIVNVTNASSKSPQKVTRTDTYVYSTPPSISEAQVIHAVQNPITCPIKYQQLKNIRLQKIQTIKNTRFQFQKQLKNIENTFNEPNKSKKRTPRKTANKNISYWEG